MCMHVYVFAYVYACVCVCICICMCTYVHVCVYMCTCVDICMCVYVSERTFWSVNAHEPYINFLPVKYLHFAMILSMNPMLNLNEINDRR